jgi:hypothetical protein
MHPRARFGLTAALAAASGCSTLLWETGLPWAQADFRVVGADRRGPFLDVLVASSGIERRYFTRATDACLALLQRDALVTLKHSEPFGPFASSGSECPVAGIGNLEDFRGSRSRGGYGRGSIRRSPDRIEIVHEDEEYLYARGGFSIAALFGWSPGTDQVVALLPKTPECAPLAEGGPVSVLYRQVGKPALGIAAGAGVCPVRGMMGVEPGDFAGGG